MFTSIWGIVRGGRVELCDAAPLEEGARLLVTVLPPEGEHEFWLHASQSSLSAIWDNPQDDAYAELLTK
jgi:hypothetical protein